MEQTQVTLYLAQFLGLFMAVGGIALLANPERIGKIAKEFVADKPLRYFGAFVELGAGLAIIVLHNVWVWGYEAIITIVGWLLVLEAIWHLTASTEMEEQVIDACTDNHGWEIFGILFVVIGLFLATAGFGPA